MTAAAGRLAKGFSPGSRCRRPPFTLGSWTSARTVAQTNWARASGIVPTQGLGLARHSVPRDGEFDVVPWARWAGGRPPALQHSRARGSEKKPKICADTVGPSKVLQTRWRIALPHPQDPLTGRRSMLRLHSKRLKQLAQVALVREGSGSHTMRSQLSSRSRREGAPQLVQAPLRSTPAQVKPRPQWR